MFFTGAKMAWTLDRRDLSMGSASHSAHFFMFSGFADPATVEEISGFAHENWRAS